MTLRIYIGIFLCISAVLTLSSLVFADPTEATNAVVANLPPINPKVCSGLDPDGLPLLRSARRMVACPKGYAFYGGDSRNFFLRLSRASEFLGACCPLPAEDVLTEEHTTTFKRCPEGFVATGSGPSPDGPCFGDEEGFTKGDTAACGANKGYVLRCTKINATRYQLGPETFGRRWGISVGHWKGDVIKVSSLPTAIRYGLSRGELPTYWKLDGCIGEPLGSLLIEKPPKNCRDAVFRELQFRGLPGDPPAGTGVPMYPECSRLDDIYVYLPKCLGK